jgi:hypothetical protein
MSKRTERREAERIARKLAFQEQRRQAAAAQANPVLSTQVAEPESQVEGEPQPQPEPEIPTISEAQLAANRANAQFSTGATTPEGKAKSSMNALKHGLTGKTVLLPTDDPAEYERQLQNQIRAFKPATEEELTLVQSMVDSAWRITRIKALETGIMVKGQIEFAGKFEDQTPARRAQLIDVETYLKYEKSIRNLNIQEARLHRRIEKDQAELLRLQANRRREEMLAAQTKPAPSRQPHPTASPKPNGFEFSTAQTDHPGHAKHAQARH